MATLGWLQQDQVTQALKLTALARQLNARHTRRRATPTRRLPPALLLTDGLRLPDPEPAAAALPRGSAVVLRHDGHPERDRLALRLARLCRARGLLLLVANDGALARRVGADGMHFSERLGPRAARWTGLKPRWLITIAAHSRPALIAAARAGADAVLLAPVFATLSHPAGAPLGPVRFAALVRASPIPAYALGGVDARSVRRLKDSGAVGIAAIGGLAGAGAAGHSVDRVNAASA